MIDSVFYTLAAIAAVLVLAGAIWTVAAAFGAARGLEALSELRTRMNEVELHLAGLAEQYEVSNTRQAAKIGKLRRALARERGEDEDEDESTRPPVPPATGPPTKADLFRIARTKGVA